MENGRKHIPAGIVSIYSKCHTSYVVPVPVPVPEKKISFKNMRRKTSENINFSENFAKIEIHFCSN